MPLHQLDSQQQYLAPGSKIWSVWVAKFNRELFFTGASHSLMHRVYFNTSNLYNIPVHRRLKRFQSKKYCFIKLSSADDGVVRAAGIAAGMARHGGGAVGTEKYVSYADRTFNGVIYKFVGVIALKSCASYVDRTFPVPAHRRAG